MGLMILVKVIIILKIIILNNHNKYKYKKIIIFIIITINFYILKGCSNLCTTCVDRADKCIICRDVNRVGETCNCKPGMFENPTTRNCEQCDAKCATCSGSSSNCTSCNDASKRTNNSSCTCLAGFWDDGD